MKVIRKHSMYGEYNSLGLLETVSKIEMEDATLLLLLAHERNSIFKQIQHTDPRGPENYNYTTFVAS